MSKQRNVVLTAVTSSCDHPTAEVVLARCKEVMPSINLATVYRNLNALVKSGEVQKVMADGGDRFDKTLYAHAHFQCRICNSVVDVDEIDLSFIGNGKFNKENKIEDVDLTLKGVCRDCLKLN